MKNIFFSVLLLSGLISNCFAGDNDRPEKFPLNAVNEIKEFLSQENYLDTTLFIDFNIMDYIQKHYRVEEDSIKGFKVIEYNKEIVSIGHYFTAKNIIKTLSEIEANPDDSDLKIGLIFKAKIELINNPLSEHDLWYVYRNWDLIEMEKH